MSVLRFRNNETGEWNEITTIKGEPGAPGPAGKDGQDGKDYILTDADKQEIAGMIEGGGGGGGASIVFLDISNDTISDESRAILEDYVDYFMSHNQTPKPNIEFIVENMYGEYILLTSKQYNNPYLDLVGYSGGVKYTVRVHIFAGAYKSAYFNELGEPWLNSGGWIWRDAYGSSTIHANDYSHLKLVFCPSNDSSNIITVDISTSHGNNFGQESGSYYNFVYYDGVMGEVSYMSFYNSGGTIDVSIPDHTLLGYYYQ